MANEVASIGVKMETDDVARGIKSLEALAEQGPRVEKAMTGVEGAVAKTGKSLKTLGEGSAKGLDEISKSSPKAADGVGRVAKSVEDAKKALAGINSSVASLGQVSTAASQSARSMTSFSSSAQASQKSLADMQAQVRAASTAVAQMGSILTSALPSMQAAAKAQADAAKSAVDMSSAFKAASDQVRSYGAAAQQAAAASKEGAAGVRNMAEASGGLNSNMRLAAQGVQAFLGLQVIGWAKDSAAALFQASAAAERLRIGLDFASLRGSADEIAYLRKTTDALGLSFASTAQAYMQFQAAAKGTALEGDKARAVFESVAKASAVMGLSAEQNTGVLLALQQMVSKGTVQAEELRGQLGERLPGAFQIAARAMGVTTAELGKMLEMGQVVSEDFLPKFAKELEKSLGGAAENAANRLDAAVNRFDNAWERMKQKAGDSGVSKAISGELEAVTRDMQAIAEAVEGASNSGAGALSALGQGAAVAAGRTGFATLNLMANTLNGTINLLTGDLLGLRTNLAVLPDVFKTNAEQVKILGVDMEGAQAKLKRLQELDAMPSNGHYYKTAIADTNAYIAKLREAIGLRNGLATGGLAGAYTEGMGNSKTVVQQRKEATESEAALEDIRQRASGVTKQYTKDLAALEQAYSRGVIPTEKEYIALVSELAQRTWDASTAGKEANKQAKAGASAAKAEQSAYATLIASVRAKIAVYEEEAKGLGKLSEGEKLRRALQEQLAAGAKTMGATRRAQAEADLTRLTVLEREKQIRDQDSKNSATYAKEIDSVWESVDAYHKKAEALVAANAVYGKGATAIEEMTLATKKQHLADLEALGLTGDKTDALEAEIAEMERYVEALQGADLKKVNANSDELLRSAREMVSLYQGELQVAGLSAVERGKVVALRQVELKYAKELSQIDQMPEGTADQRAAKEAQRLKVMEAKQIESSAVVARVVQEDWEKTSQLVGDTLADYIMGGGKDAAQYLKRLFATLVLQPMVQTAVGGLMGAGSGAGASTAGGLNLLNGLQSGHSLWSAFSGSTSGALASGVAGLGKLMGSSFLGELGSGIAAGGQLGIGGTASLMGAAGGSTGVGMAIGAAAPWVAGAAALYTLIKSFDDSGTPHSGMNARWSAKEGVYKSGEYSEFTALGLGQQWQSSQAKAVGDAVGGLAQTLGTSLDAFALAFGNKAGYVIETGFADDTSKDRAWGGLRIVEGSGSELVNWNSDRENQWAPRTFSDGEAGYQEYLDAVAVDVKAAFVAMDLPAWADQLLKAATDIDTLSAALQQIGAVKAVFDGLGKTMGMFAGLTGDAQARLLAASGSIDALASNAGAFYESFYSEADRAQKQREQQMQALAGAGLYIDPYQGGAAKEMFRKTVEEAMSSGQVELAAKLMAMSASFGATADYGQGLLDDLADAAKDAADVAKEAGEKAKQAAAEALDAMAGLAQGFASQMNAAHSSMDAAGALWDRLDAAQGGSGTGYARIREQRLWDAMVQADYRQQIDLAGQLTDMVLGRHQLEQANAQKLLDFGKSLRSYVEGLKIGALSPLTTGEKLAEAAKQYADTLTKARAGDESAMGSLQGISSSYLDLARQYFASSGDYTRIFNGVTGSLDALGVSSQSEAQLQLDVSSQSLAQLRQLQGVLWDAYGQAESEFAVEKDLLQRQVNEMLRTADGIEAVRDLLGGMPAELAAQLNGGAGTGTGSFATLAQSYVSLLGGAGGSSTDPRYVASAMGHVDSANWKSELSNAMGLLTDPGARAQMQAIFDAVARMKGIDGSHANGLGYVPFDNYMAQLHKGERVLTAEENRAYTPTWSSYGRGSGNEALVAEIKGLRAEVSQLRKENREDSQMQVRANVGSNAANAAEVVNGFGRAAAVAAHAEKIQGSYK